MNIRKTTIPQIVEVVFDTLYLCTVLLLGFYFMIQAETSIQRLYGIMAVVLGGGDSFHLVPRMASILSANKEKYITALGIGKMITSITMTFFYFILWYIGITLVGIPQPLFWWSVLPLTTLRILLCLFPQNGWTSKTPALGWGIYRNIPFFLLGLVVMLLFSLHKEALPPSMQSMAFAICLSFLFYLPVVLFSHKNPKVGMLMLPKSCAYVWIVSMGFGLFG